MPFLVFTLPLEVLPTKLAFKRKGCPKLPSLDNIISRHHFLILQWIWSWKCYINMDVMLIFPSETILFCSKGISRWQRCGDVSFIIYCVPVEQYNCCNQGSNRQLLSVNVHPLIWNVTARWYLLPSFNFLIHGINIAQGQLWELHDKECNGLLPNKSVALKYWLGLYHPITHRIEIKYFIPFIFFLSPLPNLTERAFPLEFQIITSICPLI